MKTALGLLIIIVFLGIGFSFFWRDLTTSFTDVRGLFAPPGTSSVPATPSPTGPVVGAPVTPVPSTSYTRPQVNPADIPKGFTLEQLSPYFKKVRIGSVSPGYFGGYGQVSLYAYTLDAPLNVSGWVLKANRGSLFVPKAVDVYDPSGLTPESDIVLKSGETVNIYSTTSPIGKNLHLNKCIGYLENVMTFNPQLSRSCPYISRSDVAGFTGQCQDYIFSLGSCKFPAPNPPIAINDYACRAFLDTLNYRGCFDRYRTDADFLDREWRAWTGSRFGDDRHDRILLFDRQGLLADEYSY